jgi:hypothetical protein
MNHILSIMLVVLVSLMFVSASAHWCEDWKSQIMVCQRCREFNGVLELKERDFLFIENGYEENPTKWISWNPNGEVGGSNKNFRAAAI